MRAECRFRFALHIAAREVDGTTALAAKALRRNDIIKCLEFPRASKWD